MSVISPVGFILKVNSAPTSAFSSRLRASNPGWASFDVAESNSNGMYGGSSARIRMRSVR